MMKKEDRIVKKLILNEKKSPLSITIKQSLVKKMKDFFKENKLQPNISSFIESVIENFFEESNNG